MKFKETYFCWPFCALNVFLGIGGDDFVGFNFFRCFLGTHFVERRCVVFFSWAKWKKIESLLDLLLEVVLKNKRQRKIGRVNWLFRAESGKMLQTVRWCRAHCPGPKSSVTSVGLGRPLVGLSFASGFRCKARASLYVGSGLRPRGKGCARRHGTARSNHPRPRLLAPPISLSLGVVEEECRYQNSRRGKAAIHHAAFQMALLENEKASICPSMPKSWILPTDNFFSPPSIASASGIIKKEEYMYVLCVCRYTGAWGGRTNAKPVE